MTLKHLNIYQHTSIPGFSSSKHAPSPAASTQQQQQQHLLNEANMQQYLEQHQELCDLLGGSQPLQVQQLMDGVINVVWKGELVTSSMKRVAACLRRQPVGLQRMDSSLT
jgi:hypothetical protein